MAKGKLNVSPEVAAQLADLAQQMRKLLYQEGDGIPVWGTKFSEIESDCLSVGSEIGRLMIEQSVAGQAKQAPPAALQSSEETAVLTGAVSAAIETPAGEVHWKQPRARLKQSRRDFFPSGEGVGS